MSRLFFDHLVDSLAILEKEIRKLCSFEEERVELWKRIDEYVQMRLVYFLLNVLPKEYHIDFVQRIYDTPFDEDLIKEIGVKADIDVSSLLKKEVGCICDDLMRDLTSESGDDLV